LNIKYFLDAVLVSQVYLLICHIVVNLFYITDLWAECGNDSSLPSFGWCFQWSRISSLDALDINGWICSNVFVHMYVCELEVVVASFLALNTLLSSQSDSVRSFTALQWAGWEMCREDVGPLSSLVNCLGQGPDCLLIERSVLLATCIH